MFGLLGYIRAGVFIAAHMEREASQRIVYLVQVSTSMSIVRFLSTHLSDFMSQVDMIMYSILIIQISHIIRVDYTLLRLSRRLSYLLIIEKIRPLVITWHDSNMFLHAQSLMVNAMVIMAVSMVPENIANSSEGSVLVTAVTFMYSDVLNFVLGWRDVRLTVFVVSSVAVCLFDRFTPKSRSLTALSSVGSCISITVMYLTLTDWYRGGDRVEVVNGRIGGGGETRTLLLVFITAMTYECLVFAGVANYTRDYVIFLVASDISSVTRGWVCAVAVLGVLVAFQCVFPGPRAWVTQCVLIVLINITVEMVLSYVEFLAVHDTFVTLKTSALVLQFVIHEMAILLGT